MTQALTRRESLIGIQDEHGPQQRYAILRSRDEYLVELVRRGGVVPLQPTRAQWQRAMIRPIALVGRAKDLEYRVELTNISLIPLQEWTP